MIPLSTIWDDLCDWLDLHFLGPFPAAKAVIGEGRAFHGAGEPYPFSADEVAQAAHVWHQFQAGGPPEVLGDPMLSRVLEGIGFLLGESLGLTYINATHFGDWLSQAITGISGGHGNDDEVEACGIVASRAVYGEQGQMACGAYGQEFWQRYPDGVRAVVAALRTT